MQWYGKICMNPPAKITIINFPSLTSRSQFEQTYIGGTTLDCTWIDTHKSVTFCLGLNQMGLKY